MMKTYLLLILVIVLLAGCSSNDIEQKWIATLFNDNVDPGTYTLTWDWTESDGSPVSWYMFAIQLSTQDTEAWTFITMGEPLESSSAVFKPTPDAIPTSFAIRTDKEYYQPGDTVKIEIDIPTACHALVRVGIAGLPIAPIL